VVYLLSASTDLKMTRIFAMSDAVNVSDVIAKANLRLRCQKSEMPIGLLGVGTDPLLANS
jgi:hypothetical protein